MNRKVTLSLGKVCYRLGTSQLSVVLGVVYDLCKISCVLI